MARRSRNAASAPFWTAACKIGVAIGVAAERGEDLGAKCKAQPVSRPVRDDAVEQTKSVVGMAVGKEIFGLLHERVEDTFARTEFKRVCPICLGKLGPTGH